MLFAVGIACSNPFGVSLFLIYFIEVVTKIVAPCFRHALRQGRDAFFHLSCFVVIALFKSIAKKPSSLCQMVHCPAQYVSVGCLAQV